MLFGLYLGTTAVVWLDKINMYMEMNERLKKEGYVFKEKQLDTMDIAYGALSALALSLPIFNIVVSLSTSDREQAYNDYKNQLLRDNLIEKQDEKIKQKIISTIK